MGFLFVDRITELTPNQSIKGIKYITSKDDYLVSKSENRYFISFPIVGETLAQLAGWYSMYINDFKTRPIAGKVEQAIIHRPAYLGEVLNLEVQVDKEDSEGIHYYAKASVGNSLVFEMKQAYGLISSLDEFIDPMIAKRQFDAMYHPNPNFIPYQLVENKSIDINHMGDTIFRHDKIVEVSKGQHLIAEKVLRPDEPYFDDHFPRKPVMPLNVLLGCMLNLTVNFLSKEKLLARYQLTELFDINMLGFVKPYDKITTFLTIQDSAPEEKILYFKSEVDKKVVCTMSIKLQSNAYS